MPRGAKVREIEYPESDGRPLGETDLHRWWMFYIHQLFEQRYRNQHTYVGCDLLLFYVEGDPKKFVVPDNFVVLNCKPDKRRNFQIWAEQRVPNVVIEVTSRKTKRQDQTVKPQVYAQIGVRELFLYDPTLDYLTTALQGYRLEQGRYVPIEGNARGAIECHELGIWLRLDRERLVMQDAATGETLLTQGEAAELARVRLERELLEARANNAELRARIAELENERLHEELRRRGGEG